MYQLSNLFITTLLYFIYILFHTILFVIPIAFFSGDSSKCFATSWKLPSLISVLISFCFCACTLRLEKHSPCLCWEWRELETGLTVLPSFFWQVMQIFIGDNERSSENLSLHSCLTGIQILYLTLAFSWSLGPLWTFSVFSASTMNWKLPVLQTAYISIYNKKEKNYFEYKQKK